MTETRDAHVRVRVSSGNAPAELHKIADAVEETKLAGKEVAVELTKLEKGTKKLGATASAAAPAIAKTEGAVKKAGTTSKKAATETKPLSDAVAKTSTAFVRSASSAKAFERSTKGAGNAAKTTAADITRGKQAVVEYGRAADAATTQIKRFQNATNQRVGNPFAGAKSNGFARDRNQGPNALVHMAQGVGAIGTALVAYGSAGQQALGVRDQTDIVRSAVDLRQELVRQTAPAGVTDEQRSRLFAGAGDIGRKRGVSTEEILLALNTAQEAFSAIGNAAESGDAGLASLMDDMDRFAIMSRATGASMADTTAAGLALKQQFGLTSEEMHDSLALLAQGAQDGSLGLRDFAATFPQVFGTYLTARGAGGRGQAGVAELQSVAQAIKASQGTGPEAAARSRTLLAAMLNNISDRQVQQRFRRATGQSALGADGNVRPIAQLAQAIANSRGLQNSTQFRRVFGDAEAASAWQGIVNQEKAAARGENGALTLAQRQEATGEQGRAGVALTMAALDRDVSGEAVRMRAGREADTFGSSEALIQSFASIAGPMTSLQDRFPRLSTAIESLVPTVQALVTLIAAKGITGALGGPAMAAGAGTALTGGSGMLAAAPQVLAAGIVGVGIGTALGEVAQGIADERRDAENAVARRDGMVGRARVDIERGSNFTGMYGEEGTQQMYDRLRNARAAIGSGDGAGFLSVLDKVRDVGAMDEIMANPEMRAWVQQAEQRARAQVSGQAAPQPGAPANAPVTPQGSRDSATLERMARAQEETARQARRTADNTVPRSGGETAPQ